MELSSAASEYLLSLSRLSIEHFLETKNFLQYELLTIPKNIEDEVRAKLGGFIVLEMLGNEHRKAYIRGENGVFEPVEQLGKLITQIAVNAAFFDPHTPRLKAYELNELIIHLVIPEARQRLQGNYAEVVAQSEALKSGIIIETRGRVAYDLPNLLYTSSESAEHRLRRLRLRLGIKRKSAENEAEYYSFSVQQYTEKV